MLDGDPGPGVGETSASEPPSSSTRSRPGSEADNGNNLIQRGNFDSLGQYKLRSTRTSPRAGCSATTARSSSSPRPDRPRPLVHRHLYAHQVRGDPDRRGVRRRPGRRDLGRRRDRPGHLAEGPAAHGRREDQPGRHPGRLDRTSSTASSTTSSSPWADRAACRFAPTATLPPCLVHRLRPAGRRPLPPTGTLTPCARSSSPSPSCSAPSPAPLCAGTVPAPARDGVWPLVPRPEVVAGFDPPETRWGAGHRGVDLLGHVGQPVHASLGGTVTFATPLAGRGVVVVDHGGCARRTNR